MDSAVLARPSAADLRVHRLAVGTELLGEYQDSGFEQAKYLVQRADGQVMQLPGLLYRVTASLDGRGAEEIAADLSAELGQELTGEQISFLVEERLRPVGLIAADPAEGEQPGGPAVTELPVKSDPLLALRYRVGVIPAAAAGRIAGLLTPLFARPVWMTLVAAFVAVDLWIIARGDLVGTALAGVQQLVRAPTLILAILVLTVVSGAFHECGHITACRYGGARPGDVGVGLYIVWPALYSTVTDSYRLNRAGRLRTDLGGVYFDAVFMAGLGLVYLRTGQPWLLIALVGMHTETAWQFLPSIRLDGYYILADLIGVPDLFGYVKPTLLSVLPGRPTHPKVRELKRWARRVIVLWVLLVVPTLLFYVVAFLLLAPRAIPLAWQALQDYLSTLHVAARTGDLVTTSVGVFELVLLLLPWVGAALIFWSLLRGLGRWAESRWDLPRGLGRVRRATWTAARPWVVLATLVGIGALLVARVAEVASSHPATAAEARLTDSALAAATGVPGGPRVTVGEYLAREQLAAYARLTGAFDRHETVVAAGRELAVVAAAVMVAALLTLVRTRGVRPLAVALPLLGCLAMGPAVTALATVGPGVLGAAWCAAGAAVLIGAGGRLTAVVGAAALAVGVATAPLIAVPLAGGIAVLLAGGSAGRSAGRHARPEPHRRSRSRSRSRWRWWWLPALAVLLAGGVAVGLLAGGTGGPLDGSERVVLLLVGALVIVPAVLLRPWRAAAAASAAAVVLAGLPWHGAADALPVAIATVAVLVVLLTDSVMRRPVGERAHPLIRAAVVVPVIVLVAAGALFLPGTAAERPHAALARWITGPASAGGTVAVPAGLWGDLVRDGVPAGRLVAVGPGATATADWTIGIGGGSPAGESQPAAVFGSGAGILAVQRASTAGAGSAAEAAAGEARRWAEAADRAQRLALGGLLARSPNLVAPPEVRAALSDGAVDARALVALAALAAGHTVELGPLPAPGGTPAEPATALLVTRVDGRSLTAADVPAAVLYLGHGADGMPAAHVAAERRGLVVSFPPADIADAAGGTALARPDR